MIPKKIYLNDKELAAAKTSPAQYNELNGIPVNREKEHEYVNLGQFYHDITEEPVQAKNIIIESAGRFYFIGYRVDEDTYAFDGLTPVELTWTYVTQRFRILRWAYIEDLMPKL